MSPLLNYTTTIPVQKTVSQIHGILASHGARTVMNEYKDLQVSAVSFEIDTAQGLLSIRLPVDIGATLRVLEKQRAARKLPRSYVNKEQAGRIAWRIIKDWLEAQMAILETEMVKMEQIFLPYIVTRTGQTLFEVMEGRRFLTEGRE